MRSKIDLINEELNIKNRFKETIEMLMERYDIRGNVFIYNEQLGAQEAKSGYLSDSKVVKDIDEALKEFNKYKGVFISPDKVMVGNLQPTLLEAKGTIIDLKNKRFINE